MKIKKILSILSLMLIFSILLSCNDSSSENIESSNSNKSEKSSINESSSNWASASSSVIESSIVQSSENEESSVAASSSLAESSIAQSSSAIESSSSKIEDEEINYNGIQLKLNKDQNSYSITGIDNIKEDNIILPNEYNNLPVTNIDDYVFYDNKYIKYIQLPNCLEEIGARCFKECSSLKEIIIPNTVTNIGDSAFSLCDDLRKVVLPENLKIISNNLFSNCYSLNEIELPNNIEKIGESALAYTHIYNLILPETLKYIGESAFQGCGELIEIYNLSNVNLNESDILYDTNVKKIHNSLEEKSIIVKDDNGFIFAYFDDNGFLINYIGNDNILTLPNNFTYDNKLINDYGIYKKAFYNNYSLLSITLPQSVNSIGDDAFLDCFRLREIYNLSNISLTKDTIDNGGIAFRVRIIHNSLDDESIIVKIDDFFTIKNDDYNYTILDYVGNDSDIKIGNTIFYNNNAIALEDMDNYAFYSSSIKSIKLGNVNTINDNAFNRCYLLDEIELPNVEIIKAYAFANCISLESIELPELKTLKDFAFENCFSLKNVIFSNKIHEIANCAFQSCYSLVDIIIPESIGYMLSPFSQCYNLLEIYNLSGIEIDNLDSNAIIHNSLDEKSILTKDENGFVFAYLNNKGYLVGYDGEETNLILPDSFIYDGNVINEYDIYNSAFSHNKNLKYIKLSDNTKKINIYAFEYCTNLRNIELSSNLEEIEENAFIECVLLNNLYIPKNLTIIDGESFKWCFSLKNIEIDKDNTTYDKNNKYNAIIEASNNKLIIAINNSFIPKFVTRFAYGCFSTNYVYDLYYEGTEADFNKIVGKNYLPYYTVVHYNSSIS